MERKTHDDFIKDLKDASEKIKIGSRYYHFKQPDHFYTIIDLIIIEATEEVGVVYKAEYGKNIKFVRPISSFTGVVEKDGRMMTRFTKIPE